MSGAREEPRNGRVPPVIASPKVEVGISSTAKCVLSLCVTHCFLRGLDVETPLVMLEHSSFEV